MFFRHVGTLLRGDAAVQPRTQQRRQRELDRVRQQKRQHALGQHHAERDGARAGVDDEKPRRAERIAHEQPHGRREHEHPLALPPVRLREGDDERQQHKADEVAARCAEQGREPAAKAREHRRAHCAQQQIHQHAHRAALAAEQAAHGEDRKRLQRERHFRRDADPRAHGDERRADRAEAQVSGRKFHKISSNCKVKRKIT